VWSAGEIPAAVKSDFLDSSRYIFIEVAPQLSSALFQTHYFSENLVAPGIEPGTSGSAARNSDQQTAEAVRIRQIGSVIRNSTA
jgi:hypothetical protein